MDEQISDARLQIMLRNFIYERAKDNPYYSGLFNAFLYCGKKLNPNTKVKDVIVITNGERSRILGTMHCNNPWFCPHCSAVQMSKHAARIATAIDALKHQGQLAFMLTLTVPHHRGITCNEITEILFNTWHSFIHIGNKTKKTRKNQFKLDGSNKTFITMNPFTQFCTQLQCKHRVRVIEYTWGANGWHPHMHCLFWVPKKNLQMALAWEHDLRMHWLKIAEKQTIKTLCKRRNADKESIIENTRLYFEQTTMIQEQKRQGVHISDHDGIVTAQESSQYICGWGADQELTGNYRKQASHEGHMTPYQILTAAYQATDDAERTKWLELYMEYATATKQRAMRRVQFSRTGIIQIIAKYRQTEAYTEALKKKFTEKAKWTAVVWFNARQWSEILLCRENKYLVADIIERAHLPDAREQITALLLQYDIDIRYNNPADKQEFIDNFINNPDFIAA